MNNGVQLYLYKHHNSIIMLVHFSAKRLKIFIACIAILGLAMSASAQIDYTTIIKDRQAAFYREGQYQSLRLDLENASEPLLVVFHTEPLKNGKVKNIDAILQSNFKNIKLDEVERDLTKVYQDKGKYESNCTFTDFSGIQECKVGKPISHQIRSEQGDAGVMMVQPTGNTMFLALKSEPNTKMVVNVLQLRHVSSEDLDWNESKIEDLYTECMNSATEDYDAEVCDCIKYYIPQKEDYTKYAHLTPQYKKKLINGYYNQCVREYNKMQVNKNPARIEKEVDALLKIGEQQWKNQEYEAFQKTYSEILDKGRIDDGIYTKLAESYFIMKDYDAFKKNTYLAVGTNEYNLFAQAKLIRILLLEDNYDRAVEIYKKRKGNRLPNNMTFKKYLREDIDFTINMGYVNDNVEKFQAMISR